MSAVISVAAIVGALVPALACVVALALVADLRRRLLREGDSGPFEDGRGELR